MFRHTVCFAVVFAFCACFAVGQDGLIQIKITPERLEVVSGEVVQFAAQAYDRRNQKVEFSPEWSVSSGEISQQGVFRGENTSSQSKVVTVTAQDPKTGAMGSASVLVRPGSGRVEENDGVAKLEVEPDRIELEPGKTVAFKVRLYDRNGRMLSTGGRINWKASGGSIREDGIYQAGGLPGEYKVQARTSAGALGEATVFISGVLGEIVNVKISPTATVVKAFSTTRFFATGYDSAGRQYQFRASWTATGGEIDENGVYRAGPKTGSHSIKASAPNGVTCTSSVQIEQVDVARVEIAPSQVALRPGEVRKFDIVCSDLSGRKIPGFADWSAGGGVIQPDGTYRAGNTPGVYTLTVTVERVSASASITIAERSVASRISLSPERVSLQPGHTVRFQTRVCDEQGKEMEASLQWTAHGGAIDISGQYMAGSTPGQYTVEVRADESVSASAEVTIVSVRPKETPKVEEAATPMQLTIDPKLAKLAPGQSFQFHAKAVKAGVEVDAPLSWAAQGGKIDGKGLYTAGEKEGRYPVFAEFGGIKVSAVAVVEVPKTETPVGGETLRIVPERARLKCGEQRTWQAALLDRAGNAISADFEWQVTGGTFDPQGAYTAGEEPGKHSISVTERRTGLKQAAEIEIYREASEEEPIQILLWEVGHGTETLGDIWIRGRVYAEDANLLQLVEFRSDGSRKVRSQIQVRRAQSFEFKGNYDRRSVRSIALVLYDSRRNDIHTMKRTAPSLPE